MQHGRVSANGEDQLRPSCTTRRARLTWSYLLIHHGWSCVGLAGASTVAEPGARLLGPRAASCSMATLHENLRRHGNIMSLH